MNDVLLQICRHAVGLYDSWIPYPSTQIANALEKPLKDVKKELKRLKEQGLVRSARYHEYDDWDCMIHLYNGYEITQAARKTEEYKAAYEEEREIVKEIFGFDMGTVDDPKWEWLDDE